MLFPVVCPVCERIGAAPCAVCIADLEPGGPVPAPLGIDVCHAAIAYEGAGRRLVGALKFRRARDVATWLATAMTGLVADEQVDAVTWAPTTVSHRAVRGFDQAELLARRVARRIHAPPRCLLLRVGRQPQTGRPRQQRIAGPAFAIVGQVPAAVLLVDDVVTTGATLAAAATALRDAGAKRVVAVVAAATPPPGLGPGALDLTTSRPRRGRQPVEVTVSSRHLEISSPLREAATAKVGRLERYLSGMDRGEVHFSEERNPRINEAEVCEVTLDGHGHHVRCKASGPDPFIALDRAVEKLERQLVKEKSKKLRRHKARHRARRKA